MSDKQIVLAKSPEGFALMIALSVPAKDIVPGLVCGYVFDLEGHGTPVNALSAPPADHHAFDWYHLDLTDARSTGWIGRLPGMTPDVLKTFAAPLPHQMVARVGDWVVGSRADMQLDFDHDVDESGRLVFALGPDRLVSGRRHALQSVERVRASLARGATVSSPVDLLDRLIGEFASRLEESVMRLMHDLDTTEDRVLSETVSDERRRLVLLRRDASHLHRHLRGLLRALDQTRHAPGEFEPRFMRLRDRFAMIDQDFSGIEDRARLLQEEVAAKVASEINNQLYILSLLTAMFLPPALVAGLFGMNVGGIPFSNDGWGFVHAVVLSMLSSLSVWLMIRYGRRG